MPNILKGVVTKTGAMRKTITVTIARTFEHPKLLKEMKRTHKMLVHDETEKAKVDDLVTIIHGKPFSARKHFNLLSIDHRPSGKVEAALSEQSAEQDPKSPTPEASRL